MAGRSSDLLGRACVCCVCMCWWSLFTSSVSLHSYPLSSPVQLITTFSFLAGAALLKKVSYFSIHSSHLLLAFQLLQLTLSFFLYVLYLWSYWTLGDFQLLKLSYFSFFSFLLYFILIFFFFIVFFSCL